MASAIEVPLCQAGQWGSFLVAPGSWEHLPGFGTRAPFRFLACAILDSGPWRRVLDQCGRCRHSRSHCHCRYRCHSLGVHLGLSLTVPCPSCCRRCEESRGGCRVVSSSHGREFFPRRDDGRQS